MATISENLQILKDSTAAIKQAIIDKGGTIEGDITTWADAINGLSGGSEENHSEINTVYVGKKPVDSGMPMAPDATYVAAHCFFQKPLDSIIQINAMVSTGEGIGTSTVNGNVGDTSVITTGIQDNPSFCVDVYKHFTSYGEIFGNSKYIYDIKYLESKYITLKCTETGPDEYQILFCADFPVPSDLYVIIDGDRYGLYIMGDGTYQCTIMHPTPVTVDDVTLTRQYDDKYYYVVTSNN